MNHALSICCVNPVPKLTGAPLTFPPVAALPPECYDLVFHDPC